MMKAALQGGFADAAVQSSQAFRACLNAMARPGSVQMITGAVPPAPLSPAAGAVLLTLCDSTTPLYLAGAHDCADLRAWIIFHCGAALVGPQDASFALGRWDALQPVDRFAIGEPDYPDRSATLIVEVETLVPMAARLTGPGIETEAALALPELAAFQTNHRQFPLGFDCFFTCCDQISGLPRSTRVEGV